MFIVTLNPVVHLINNYLSRSWGGVELSLVGIIRRTYQLKSITSSLIGTLHGPANYLLQTILYFIAGLLEATNNLGWRGGVSLSSDNRISYRVLA